MGVWGQEGHGSEGREGLGCRLGRGRSRGGTLSSVGREKGGLKIGTAEGGELGRERGGWIKGDFTFRIFLSFFFFFFSWLNLCASQVGVLSLLHLFR